MVTAFADRDNRSCGPQCAPDVDTGHPPPGDKGHRTRYAANRSDLTNFLKDTPKILFRRQAHGSISVQEGQLFVHAANLKSRVPSSTRRKSGSGAKHIVL